MSGNSESIRPIMGAPLSVIEVCIEGNPSSTEKYHLVALGLHEEGCAVTMLWFLHSAAGLKAFRDLYCSEIVYAVDAGINGQLYVGGSWIGKLWNNISIGLSFGRRLAAIIRHNKADIVIIPPYHLELIMPAVVVCRLFRVKLVPNVMEYNPALPNFNKKKNFLHRLSWRLMLRAASGFVAISEYLKSRLNSDTGKSVFILPAITRGDAGASSGIFPEIVSDQRRRLLYASSSAYIELLEFVIEALALVGRDDYELLITGKYHDRQVAHIIAMAERFSVNDRVRFTGFLTKNDLMKEQLASTALLMPLLDNDQHKARFPQKILEYMMIPRPIVSSSVGEIGRLFSDGENAYIDHTLTPLGYARKIEEVLEDPDRAKLIARAGREYVTEEFDYRLWGQRLKKYFSNTLH